METKELETKLTSIGVELEKFIVKHDAEVKANGTATTETKTALEKIAKDFNETSQRLLLMEQKIDAHKFGGGNEAENKSVGELVIESEGYKALKAGGPRTGPISIGSFD